MKKILVSLSFASLMLSIVFLSSCSKDDTTAPVVTLAGDASIELSLNTSSWTDPGATASDDEDGTVSVSSDNSSTNPNLNLVGTYTVTYTAVDAAGNVGTAVRTIRVKNDAEDFAGNYNVLETSPGLPDANFTQVITIDETINNRIHFNKFANYANNTNIYATKLPNGELDLPAQTALNIGSVQTPPGACDVSDHQFTGISCSLTLTGFVLVFTDQGVTLGCTATGQFTDTYTRQ